MKHLALLTAALAACAIAPADDQDEIDESFLDFGKADTGSVSDAESDGVLRVANELSAQKLHQAGVATAAATNIVAYRYGDDGSPGTADDDRFDTLAELDAVPFVGPTAFAKLLEYAHAHGYITAADNYTMPSCTPMGYADLLANFEAGETYWYPGAQFSRVSRSRTCNASTGCGSWLNTDISLVQMLGRNGSQAGSLHALPASGHVAFEIKPGGSMNMYMTAPEEGAPTTVVWTCWGLEPGQTADQYPCRVEVRPDADTLASVMQFFDTYNGQWTTGNATMLIPEMTICKDGRFHLVTKLAPEISPSIRLDGPNNSNQIAVFGKL